MDHYGSIIDPTLIVDGALYIVSGVMDGERFSDADVSAQGARNALVNADRLGITDIAVTPQPSGQLTPAQVRAAFGG